MAQAWTITRELDTRTWIRSKILEIYPTLAVFTTPFYFTSKQDFIGQLQPSDLTLPITDYDKLEIKFIMMTFLRFRDSKTEGCDDNPVVFPRYNLHVFVEFKDVRDNSTNSHDDLMSMLVNLRNKFLVGREHPSVGQALSHAPLEQFQNTTYKRESPYLAEVIGDWHNLEVEVEAR